MEIQNGTRKVSFAVEGYQYPKYTVKSKDYDYDANWLNIVIIYTDDTGDHRYIDACLLTYEYESLPQDIEDVVLGKESICISGFMEPYLKFSVIHVNDSIMFGISYVYDTSNGVWRELKIAEQLSLDRACDIVEELKATIRRFPQR